MDDRGHRPRLCRLICAVAGQKSSIFMSMTPSALVPGTSHHELLVWNCHRDLPASRLASASLTVEPATIQQNNQAGKWKNDSHPARVRPHIDVVSGVHLAAIIDISRRTLL